jgi:hypothetical protein
VLSFQTKPKIALEVQSRFKATIDNPLELNQQLMPMVLNIQNSVIIDEKPNIITHYNWG